MALRRILLAVAGVAAFSCVASAQTTVPGYRSQGGQVQDGIGTQPLGVLTATSVASAGSVTTGGTFKTAIAANAKRLGCVLQNTSATNMQVYVGSAALATGAASLNLPANATFNCGQASGLVITDEIAVTSATAGATFVTVVQ